MVHDTALLDRPDALKDYLVGHHIIGQAETISVTPLEGGVSNKIVKVATPERTVVIKQAQPKLKVQVDWFANVDRALIEAKFMQVLQNLLPAGVVPRIYAVDPEQYLFVMECAPEDSVLWKADLMRGTVDLDVCRRVGEILGTMHGKASLTEGLAHEFWDNHILYDLRINPLFRYLAEIHPELSKQIDDQIKSLEHVRICLVMGDYTAKNIMLSSDRLILLDYEIVHWGNPALDSGMMIAHLMLKAFCAPQWATRYISGIRAMWESYLTSVKRFDPMLLEFLTARMMPFLMLARLDSKSPVEYLQGPSKDRAREFAIRFIKHPSSTLEPILAALSAR
jgi:tRNA A-37 threonylcarbamoyl transferase component Bud32